jgi:hypothetical protein
LTPAKQKPTSPAKLERIVRTWQKRLMLEHFDIELDLQNEPEVEEALAAVTPSELYDMAVVQFRGDWQTHDLYQLNRIVVHELLHIMFRDYGMAVRSVSVTGSLSSDVRMLWHDRCHDAEEGLIDRLAQRLVDLGGVVR